MGEPEWRWEGARFQTHSRAEAGVPSSASPSLSTTDAAARRGITDKLRDLHGCSPYKTMAVGAGES